MARIRTLKPEFWQSEKLAQCSAHARLLAIALLQLADSKGRMKWIPMQVHAHAFPFEEDLSINELAGELEAIGYLQRYEHDGKRYAWIPGFTDHQRLSGKEAQYDSNCPQPPDAIGGNSGEAPSFSPGSTEFFPGKQTESQEQGTGNREKEPPTPPAGGGDGFDEFWSAYPKHVGKEPARRAWRRLKASERQAVMDHLPARIRGDPQWLRDGGKFIPNPATFLNQKRWLDEYGESQANGTTGAPTWI